MSRAGTGFAVICLLAAASASVQNAPPMRVRGTVASISGQELTVNSRDGATAAIKLAPDYAVTAVVKADISDIVGKFVGIAAVPQGSEPERALEVLVFPESARGSGEGHYG